jgi:hypothetical protein
MHQHPAIKRATISLLLLLGLALAGFCSLFVEIDQSIHRARADASPVSHAIADP